MSEVDRLKMNFPTNNKCWRDCENSICSWGQRAKPKDPNGQLRGMTAPLWKNPAKVYFAIMCAIAFVLGVLFIIAFIVIKYKNDDILEESEEEAVKSPNDRCVIATKKKLKAFWIVIGAILIFLNALCYCFLSCKSYGSDQDWSRYIIITLIFSVLLIAVNIAQYVINVDNLTYYKNNDVFQPEDKDDKGQCKNLFKANLIINFIVAALSTILEICVIVRIIFITYDFFIKSYVPHSAKCVDDDIIIIE